MMGSTHLMTGVVSATWTAVGFATLGVPPLICVLAVPVGAYSALLPDLDHPRATATWSLPPVSNLLSWVIRGAPYDFAVPIVGTEFAGRLLPWTIRHRYETHTEVAAVLFGLVLGLPLWLLPDPLGSYWWVFAIAITVGCLTHLWGDMRTSGGLPRSGNRRGRRTIGRTFDVGSDHEYLLRDGVYRFCAIGSVVLGLFLVSWLRSGVVPA
jgi:membrane-bound metal-dependent hydrolase YbcI (DUF457 family)